MKRDEDASVGIGTLITFIAIVLVSMIVCSTIIMTMEKAFKNQTNTAETTEQNGKIIVDSIFIYRFQPCWVTDFVSTEPDCSDAPGGNQRPWGHHQLLMNFHLAPGSTPIEVTNANYVVRCENEGVTDLNENGINDGRQVETPMFASSFDGSATSQVRASGAPNNAFENGFVTKLDEEIRVSLLDQDQSYKIKLELFDNLNSNANDAPREGCRISTYYDTTLLITLGGGFTTEYTLHFRSYEIGQLVI